MEYLLVLHQKWWKLELPLIWIYSKKLVNKFFLCLYLSIGFPKPKLDQNNIFLIQFRNH